MKCTFQIEASYLYSIITWVVSISSSYWRITADAIGAMWLKKLFVHRCLLIAGGMLAMRRRATLSGRLQATFWAMWSSWHWSLWTSATATSGSSHRKRELSPSKVGCQLWKLHALCCDLGRFKTTNTKPIVKVNGPTEKLLL